ncbi:MAG: hypothetical protein K2Y21_05840 [Phycisphaerales bacterium]|nr:hypothetical protein [Phycisphaerales bacterium]
MTAWIFTILAWLLVLAGVFIAWRFGWRDPEKGTRRCPRCGYDMTATGGLRCSECGHEARRESRLFGAHRRWRWLAAGCVCAVTSYPVMKWPLYSAFGPIGFAPRVLTLAALPEVLDWYPTLTRSKPTPAYRLLDNLSKVQPFDRVERYAFAHMYRRCLTDPERRKKWLEQFSFLSRYAGDQSGVLADVLVELLDDPKAAVLVMHGAGSMPPFADPRMVPLARKLAEKMRSGKEAGSRLVSLEHLAAWGCPDAELREVAIERVNREGSRSERALEFLWQNKMLRDEDAAMVVSAALAPTWPFASYGTLAALDLPTAKRSLAPFLSKRMLERLDLQCVGDWSMLEAACGPEGEAFLPALDQYAMATSYPTFPACGQIAALSIRGFGPEAYELWKAAMAVSNDKDYETVPLRYHVCLLILGIDIPVQQRAEGIAYWIELATPGITPNSSPGSLLTAIDAAARLGPAASPTLDAIIDTILPTAPGFVVERSLRALENIGSLTTEQGRRLSDNYRAWSSTPSPPRYASPVVEATYRRLSDKFGLR